MKGVVFHTTGDSSVLQVDESLPIPVCRETEVLIQVEYSGVNFVDVYQRIGLYSMELPSTVGREGAGTIVKIGADVEESWDLHVGDRVAVFAQGATAEYVCAPPKSVMKLPQEVSTKEGAALMLQGLTAWTLATDAHAVRRGETILVCAAAGGTGGLLAQIGKHLGAKVIGTVSNPTKAEVAREHGCDHVIIYTQSDVVSEVLRLTDGQGCHAVFSGVGRSTFDADLACTRRKGTLCSYGNSSGPVENFRILDLTKKNIKLVRPTLHNYISTNEEFTERSRQLLQMVASGAVKARFGGEYDLMSVGAAQDDLTSQKTMGKLIVRIN